MSLRFSGRSVVFPPQTDVHGQVWAKFPVVLYEHTVSRRPEIFRTSGGRGAGEWVHFNRFEDRRSVRKIPRSLENLNRTSAADQRIVVLLVAVLEPKLQRLIADHLGEHIAESVSILCQDSRRSVSLVCPVVDSLSARRGKTLNLNLGYGPVYLGI